MPQTFQNDLFNQKQPVGQPRLFTPGGLQAPGGADDPRRRDALLDFQRQTFGAPPEDAIQQAGRQFLGREFSPQDLQAHVRNPGGLSGALNTIVFSPEAGQFGQQEDARRATDQAALLAALQGDGQAQAAGGPRGFGGLSLSPVQQAQGGTAFRGFNDERALAAGDPKSVKDAFRRIVGGLGVNVQGLDMGGVENALRTQIAPALQAAGVNVLDVKNDKILVETAERGPEWVDVVQNAGGADAAFQWLPDIDNQGVGGGAVGRNGGAFAGFPGLTDFNIAPGLLSAFQGAGGAGDNSVLQQIQRELAALVGGQPSQADRNTLLQLLGEA